MDASALLFRAPAPGVEAVEIENRIQHQRIRPTRFASIHRIDRKQHHVALARWHVELRDVPRFRGRRRASWGYAALCCRRDAKRHALELGVRGKSTASVVFLVARTG